MIQTTAVLLVAFALIASGALGQTTTPKPASGVPTKAIAALTGLQGQAFEVAYLSSLLKFHDAAYELVQEEYVAGKRTEVKAAGDAMLESLEIEGQVAVGVVHDQLRRETFTATAGGGAFLNGRPIRVSGVAKLGGRALVGMGATADPSLA